MNAGYEYDVSTTPGGSIVRRITEVEPDGVCHQILAQVFDTVEQQSRDALVKLGWTPPATATFHHKCVVKGCNNYKGSGRFVGDLCAPCHHMLTTGNAAFNATFVGELYQKANQLAALKSQVQKLIKE